MLRAWAGADGTRPTAIATGVLRDGAAEIAARSLA
jgi:hypothetical protein